ncbi:hypothetical protein [Paenibacillus sp. NPDC058071]|uniref:hypothetical protein n=1 Tax=Paenibacillus sp. NPDC058071 TaxID=3346326 RepID=UPI0036D98EFF
MEEFEQRNEPAKRSLALPITLVLLVFSLIGNVFFYSQYLQNKQEAKFRSGQHVIETANAAKTQYEAILTEMKSFSELNKKGVYGPYAADGASLRAVGDTTFIAEAYAAKGEKLQELAKVQQYFQDVRQNLDEIRTSKGPFSEWQTQYLAEKQQELMEQYGIIGKFNFEAVESRSAVIQMASGIGSFEIAEKLAAAILARTK